MEHRHLWVRSPRQSAILRIRAEIMRAAAEYFDTNGFIRTDPPILTPAACEGTSTLFPVDYFGDPAYLTQSGQLYIESTALALGKVYSFGPTFPRRKIQNPPSPHRVLDDRARSRLHGPRRPPRTG
jgi:asparaginyl-tRNA synthetase